MPRSTRWVLPILSIAALLILASAPVLAEADSSGAQYEDALPSGCGPSPCQNGNLSAHSGSDSDSSHSGSANDAGDEDASSAESDHEGGGSPGEDTQGKSKHRADHKSADQAPPKAKASAGDATQDGDGGSSPLVPILIAIAVLAALSAGVVLYRRKREQRPSDEPPSATPPT